MSPTPARPWRARAAALALLLPACSGSEPEVDAYADVVFEAKTNEDALATLLEAPTVEDPMQAAYLTAPAAGATSTASEPLAFKWRVGPPAASAPRHPAMTPTPPRSDGDRGRSDGNPLVRVGASLRALAHELAPLGTAYAHGVPVNGRGYFLVVTDAQGTPVYRVFSLGFETLVGAAKRGELAAAPQPLRASVTNAVFENDALAPGGGPWKGPEITFTVTP